MISRVSTACYVIILHKYITLVEYIHTFFAVALNFFSCRYHCSWTGKQLPELVDECLVLPVVQDHECNAQWRQFTQREPSWCQFMLLARNQAGRFSHLWNLWISLTKTSVLHFNLYVFLLCFHAVFTIPGNPVRGHRQHRCRIMGDGTCPTKFWKTCRLPTTSYVYYVI